MRCVKGASGIGPGLSTKEVSVVTIMVSKRSKTHLIGTAIRISDISQNKSRLIWHVTGLYLQCNDC